ncbi:pentapeptide repeat-containing protein [Tsukamurella strandjordii]|uniref:Pentapeptide repeat-containing protein n=1 Tax=Tsukamurella strandjordii TaxID=147577 RepID=A0AA90SHM9_9ACTN|nr:pentapeptide repeat-containing protein [Tsukamurella strandjordii]MDP0398994.1 pentapeptide repeat-containing protein [Tsukamurella strandjordii]
MIKLVAPKVPALKLAALDDGDAADLVPGETYDRLRFADAVVEDRDLGGITFSECELADWELRETALADAALLETRIARMFATGFSAPRASLWQVEFDGARIGAMELFDAKIRSVTVRDSRLGFVNLRGADIRDVRFVDCVLDGLDLGDATAIRVAFDGCSVGDLDVTRAKLQHVDLRGLRIERIRGVEGIAGATMSQMQVMGLAESFAAHLGIAVTD